MTQMFHLINTRLGFLSAKMINAWGFFLITNRKVPFLIKRVVH